MGFVAVQTFNERIEVKCEELIRKIESTLPTLDTIYQSNKISILRGGPIFRPNINKTYCIMHLEHLSTSGAFSAPHNEELKELIDSSRMVVDACKTSVSKMIGTHFVYTLESAVQNSSYTYGLARLINADACPQCKGNYTESGLSSHLGSLHCLKDAQCLDVKEAGYVLMNDQDAVVAIRKAGIEFKVRPRAVDMWVLPWVVQAVKDYRKNKAFAGLKLHEFLKAVQGDGSNITT